ncbi:hypothetical protein JWJ90_12780 [Desulfobulbus rhabdoformis]|uniref:MotE family protein n=1 Tax=Desulfobulbus rhabdoformis TaxID=34032 RepID=UPI00196514E8|nr:hypothetical protein [Desulfobulbus rhabdoformis]MBM9615154.1 hypothetical protein [Desulfobulbus rhabdoformis]
MNTKNQTNNRRRRRPHAPVPSASKTKAFLLAFHLLFCLFITQPTTPHAADTPEKAPTKNGSESSYDSVEERRIMEAIKASGTNQLESEQEELERRKKELKRLESEVDKKIVQLNELRIKLEKLLKQKEAAEQKRIIELAKMYEKMPAEKGAVVIGNLQVDLAISILSKMKTKSAAKVLASMDRQKAAKLTTAFSTLDFR